MVIMRHEDMPVGDGALDHPDQQSAEAALAGAVLGPDELASIFRTYPELRVAVATYEGATPPFLAWITTQDDEAAAESARRRLQQLASPSPAAAEPKNWFLRWLRRIRNA